MKRETVYRFEPFGWDVIDPRAGQPEAGTLVVKTQPAGCPRNGTMGHCFVADAETGAFYGLVSESSLERHGTRTVERDESTGAIRTGEIREKGCPRVNV